MPGNDGGSGQGDGGAGSGDGDGAGEDPETYTLEFVNEDREIECRADQYIMDAAEQAGIEIPFGCLMGVCTICSARIEGETDQSEGAALIPEEEEKGYVLTCIAYPRSDLRVWTGEGP